MDDFHLASELSAIREQFVSEVLSLSCILLCAECKSRITIAKHAGRRYYDSRPLQLGPLAQVYSTDGLGQLIRVRQPRASESWTWGCRSLPAFFSLFEMK